MTNEQATFTAHMLVDGLEREHATTRKVLAAVPEGKKDHRPDPNARSAFELAGHIASSDVWFLNGIAKGEFNPEPDKKFASVAEIVAYYDKEYPAALARVKALPAEKLAKPIPFFGVFNLPAAAYLGFVSNHCIHHRGQLSSYLRPMGGKCPNIYGGSFDEPMQMPAGA
ncbi:MAG: DinB family protein [Acidipila sp.]|nr:DinB family protein [Acidipila sp.]